MISMLPATAASQVRTHSVPLSVSCAARCLQVRRHVNEAGKERCRQRPGRGKRVIHQRVAEVIAGVIRCAAREAGARQPGDDALGRQAWHASTAGPVAMTASQLGNCAARIGAGAAQVAADKLDLETIGSMRDTEVQRQDRLAAGQKPLERLRPAAPLHGEHFVDHLILMEMRARCLGKLAGSARPWHCCRRPGRGRSR